MAALRYMSGKQLTAQRTERERRLDWIGEQVASGDLVIRQATVEERERYGMNAPRPATAAAARGPRKRTT